MSPDLHDPDDEEPLFDSVDEMCAAFGFDAATKAEILLNVELTRPREPGDMLH